MIVRLILVVMAVMVVFWLIGVVMRDRTRKRRR
jgi:uncharacterized membrane protein